MPERKTLFADVILPVPIFNEFTYRVPFDLNEHVRVGCRVVVPFGKAKLQTGIITKIHEEVPREHTSKYIEHLLDDEPIITGKQYQFWKWMASYYMSPIGDVMNAALPSNFKLASETKIVLNPDYTLNEKFLTERELEVHSILSIRDDIDLKELSEIIGIKTIQPLVKALIDKRVIVTLEELRQKYTPKTAVFIRLLSDNDDDIEQLIASLDNSPSKAKQLESLLLILQGTNYRDGRSEPVSRKELVEKGASQSSLNTLEKMGVISQERLIISRFEDGDPSGDQFKDLSPAQKTALEEIELGFEEDRVCLLHGVTGSGKTEIYVQLIQEQLDQGKQVLFLLPEIALTTQLIQRLSKYFGDQIGVYHSKFNQNERIEIWQHVLNNNPDKFRIILGARSAIFLPFRELGLVIVDEEHESTFKQYDPSPRYNGRDCAIVLGKLFNANVLLGSATPSIESYYNATQDKYKLIGLAERYASHMMPEILCADLKKERRQKSIKGQFSNFLIEEMRTVLNKKEQVILFQNRRGYSPLWMCEVCNWTPKCKNCDVSLTYHKHNNSLRCHYCGYSTAPIGTCTSCGSNRLQMLGYGTEKIEDEIQLLFPDSVVRRLDLDTTRSKNAYAEIIDEFGKGAVDILIGTQMVTKGLDFDKVTLVGVIDADMLLNRSDFRAFERTFQLITQVAGRAGRREERGKVIVQTGDPDHWVIQKIVSYDYNGFVKDELIERRNYFYPPFYKLIQLTLRHKDENIVAQGADELANLLKHSFKERVLGPEFPVIKRVNNYFLKTILIKIERDASDKKVKEHLHQLIDRFYSAPLNKSIRVIIDVDPA
jgi:primosomal protein N' (replication factor Y) (superfamily II helicase)